MDTLIYWCGKCGKRFARESSTEPPGEAGSIFCTDCAAPKGTRLSTGKLRTNLRASQTSIPPAQSAHERPPSERLHVPHHTVPSVRTERAHGKPRVSPVLLLTAVATVTAVAPSVDPKTRTGLVRLAPHDPEGKLRDGMLATVRIAVDGR